MVNKTFTEWEMRNNFERKRGLIIVTAQGKIDLHWLIAACKSTEVNVCSLLGHIYTRMGKVPKAMDEYMQAIEECIKARLFGSGIATCKKMLQVLECLSDINKIDLPEHNRISNRQPLLSRG